MNRCIKEITLDLKDYKEGGTVFRREAVKGVIRRGNAGDERSAENCQM